MRSDPKIIRSVLVASLAVWLLAGGANIRAQTGEVPRDTVITLERTECFGFCPSYILTITADGAVIFEGRRHVKHLGAAKSTVSREQLQALINEFEKINYFELRERYEDASDGCKEWRIDHPSAITSITINRKSKSVRHYYGCVGLDVLAKLEKLEQAIDEAANTAQWIR